MSAVLQVACRSGPPAKRFKTSISGQEPLRSHSESADFDEEEANSGTRCTASEPSSEDVCLICLGPFLDKATLSTLDNPADSNIVHLVCWHAFHLPCLASHVQAKCQEAEESAQAELRGRDTDLELEREARTNVLGVTRTLAEMYAHGQIRQCPQCQYGPVLNTNCTDLQRHDLDRGYGLGRTTNSCPNCSFFSARWSDWSIWNSADPTVAARCPLCREPCRVADDEVPELQRRFSEADRQFKALSAKLSESLHRSRRSRNRCEDLIALLLHLQDEIQGPTAPTQAGLSCFEELVALGESPERFQQLLQGPLHDLLRRRLVLEEDQVKLQNAIRNQEAKAAPGHDTSSGSVRAEQRRGGGRPTVLSPCQQQEQQRHHFAGDASQCRRALNEEILDLALRPGARSGSSPEGHEVEDAARALGRHLQELTEHRRHLAVLLCTASDRVDMSVVRSLGRPWHPEAAGGSPVAPILRRDAMEHRILLRRRMMATARREPEDGRGLGFDRQPWSFVIRLLRELLDAETLPLTPAVHAVGLAALVV